MKQFILGLVVGGGAAFATGFFKASGESAWRTLSRKTASALLVVKGKGAERTAKRAGAKAAIELDAERTRLTSERVGVRFRRRYTKDDTGTLVKVTALRDRDWQTMVHVKEISPAKRKPTPYDPELPRRYGISWADLTKTYEAQQHMTARLIENSDDDSDGWIDFERLD